VKTEISYFFTYSEEKFSSVLGTSSPQIIALVLIALKYENNYEALIVEFSSVISSPLATSDLLSISFSIPSIHVPQTKFHTRT
jgi:hypothetical protein